jgi:NDP-sugar pyrophosphorylase family protein
MMAVILAGGKGTRLRPFTLTIPKPLLPLGEMPIIEVVLRQLAAAGVSRVVITIGHLAHLFEACVGDGARSGLKVAYLQEDSPLGTAGSLRLVDDPDENMLVMNGDILTTIDYAELMRSHVAADAWATIACHRRTAQIDYGVIETTTDGYLDRYVEKPSIPYLVSMGVNVVSRRSLELIPRETRFDVPDLMTALRKAQRRVLCHETDCYWQDIGRLDDYQQASTDFEADPSRFLAPR